MNIIGIDGGATSTKCVVTNEHGEVLAVILNSPPVGHDVESVYQAIRHVATHLPPELTEATVVVAGIAGYGVINTEEVKAIISQFFKAQAVLIYSDVQIAFLGATQGMPGAIVYAGTGSFAYGVNELGVQAKVGGWGYIFDDLGSAYDIGRRALQSVFSAEDGRAPPTILRDKILAHFECGDLRNLLIMIYRKFQGKREVIARLAPIVVTAAEEGDEVAQEILHAACSALAHMGLTVLRRLNAINKPFRVYYSGGVFRAGDIIVSPFIKSISSQAPLASVEQAYLPPVGGTVLAGLIHIGKSEELHVVVNNLRSKLKIC